MSLDRDETLITYADMPDAWKDRLKELMCHCVRFVPRWCIRLEVTLGNQTRNGGNGEAACIDPNFMYRCAHLTINPIFFDQSDTDQQHALTHELAHVILAPLHQFCSKFMGEIEDRRENIAWVEFFKSALEGTTEDLTNILEEVYERAREATHSPSPAQP